MYPTTTCYVYPPPHMTHTCHMYPPPQMYPTTTCLGFSSAQGSSWEKTWREGEREREILIWPFAHTLPLWERARERDDISHTMEWRHLHLWHTVFSYWFNTKILSTLCRMYSTLCRVPRRASSPPSAPLPLPRTPTIRSLGFDRPWMPRSCCYVTDNIIHVSSSSYDTHMSSCCYVT